MRVPASLCTGVACSTRGCHPCRAEGTSGLRVNL